VVADLTYAPGQGLVIAYGAVAMLLVDNTDDQLVGRVWDAMRGDATFDRLAEVLAEYGLRRLPSLGLAALTADGVRLLVRGAVTAGVGPDSDGVTVGAEATVIWLERSFAGASEVSLSSPSAVSGALPLVGGVVVASGVRVSAGTGADPVLSAWAPFTAVPVPVPVLLPQDEPDSEPEPVVAELELPAEPKALGEPEPQPLAHLLESVTQIPEPEPEPEVRAEEVEPPMHTTVAPDVDDDYDHLFGATRHFPVESALVQPSDRDDEPPQPPMVRPPVAAVGEPPAVKPPSEVLPVANSGLIDAVPGGVAYAPTPAQHPTGLRPAAQLVGDHDGMTMSREQLLALRGVAAAAPVSVVDPHQVLAVSCPGGHLNPPHAQRCRICQDQVSDQAPVAVTRPSLGWLRFSTGAEVALDRPVIIGRMPSAERVAAGADLPQLVTLESPSQDISRRHVEVQLEGWHVLVRDLGSTNGTVVTPPGRNPERLHAGESLPMIPGTVVTITEGTSFSYEVGL
jgi:hypothetical protein